VQVCLEAHEDLSVAASTDAFPSPHAFSDTVVSPSNFSAAASLPPSIRNNLLRDYQATFAESSRRLSSVSSSSMGSSLSRSDIQTLGEVIQTEVDRAMQRWVDRLLPAPNSGPSPPPRPPT